MSAPHHPPLLYTDLASWWPLLSPPEEYAEEADLYRRLLSAACPSPRTLLELGSGGGNNASHLKAHFQMTLVDRSADMLAVSRALNPECEHVEGDMRTVRLGRLFDAVFIHDAIVYMTTEMDLRGALTTASAHCRPGGAALFVPDFVAETFRPTTDCGGHDGVGRGLRYLEWIYDPDPSDTSYEVEYAYLLREGDGPARVVQDHHTEGLFARQTWLRLLGEVGFAARVVPWEHGELFVGVRA
jgi:SAM-dependent methyltransferase